MKYYKSVILAAAATMVFAASSANAVVIDFAEMGNTTPGEGGTQPLHIDLAGGLTLDIFGYDADGPAFAYLDSNTGGLGVCSNLDSGMQCNPGGDDNVTVGEYLEFVFSAPVHISSMSFNNNHDVNPTTGMKGFAGSEYGADASRISVGGYTFTTPTTGKLTETYYGPFGGGLVTDFIVAYDNTQFYVESMKVPEPAGIALLGIGLLGFAATQRKRVRKN